MQPSTQHYAVGADRSAVVGPKTPQCCRQGCPRTRELARVVVRGAPTDTRQQSLPNGLVVRTGMHGCYLRRHRAQHMVIARSEVRMASRSQAHCRSLQVRQQGGQQLMFLLQALHRKQRRILSSRCWCQAAAGAIDEGWAVCTKWHDMLTAASKRSSFRGVAARLADPCVANAHLALLQARVAANPETQRKCPTLVSVRPSRRCMADGSAN